MPEKGEEPKIYTDADIISHGGNLQLTYKGEQYKGQSILDTKVEIEGGTLCWITWSDRKDFFEELKTVIDKYAI